MWLVMTALNHDAHKPERLEFGEGLCIARYDGELYAIWQFITFCIPAGFAQLLCMRRNHTFDRLKRAALAYHCELYPSVNDARRSGGMKRDLVHVDQMLPQ